MDDVPTHMASHFDYAVQCIYGGDVEPVELAGTVAIVTVHKGTSSRDMEIAVGKRRSDIGMVRVADLHAVDRRWVTVDFKSSRGPKNSRRR